jgi:cysteine desulfurase / selenocysteine lyase
MDTTIVWVLLFLLVFAFVIFYFSREKEREKPKSISLDSIDTSQDNFTHLFADRPTVELPTGDIVEFRNLDNAASTPPFKIVAKALNDFLPYYSGVHRGSGFNSQLSTAIFDQCIEIIMDFVGANNKNYVCLLGKNASECLNKLAYYCKGESKKKIVISVQEHHSNLIPWMPFDPEYVKIDNNGALDLIDLENKLVNQDVLMVSLTGASNVTGIINNIDKISRLVHRYGAMLSIDGAQLVPHQPVDIQRMGIDFLTFSAHKMYAPYGVGILIGWKSFFEGKEPILKGGGEVELVTMKEVYWKESPDKDNEGSPNVMGVLALAKSIMVLKKITMSRVAEHEDNIIRYCLSKLKEIPEVNIMTYLSSEIRNIGIVSFQVRRMHHCLVSAILNYEFGIGCRSGCFCASLLVGSLLGVNEMCVRRNIENLEKYGDKRNFSGMIRFSIGLGVTKKDIDYAIYALKKIINQEYELEYDQVACGEYIPVKKDGSYFDIKGWEKKNFHRHYHL